MEGCIFCNFKDQSVIIHQDEFSYSVISKDPINRYHVLVIPRKHYENFIDLPDDLACHLFLIAKKLSEAVRKICNPEAIHHVSDDDILKKGYNLVPHYKFHIIPRFKNDGTEIKWKRQVGLSNEVRSLLAAEVKDKLS